SAQGAGNLVHWRHRDAQRIRVTTEEYTACPVTTPRFYGTSLIMEPLPEPSVSASTATTTRDAPAARRARAASLAVFPVVRTSSTSRIVLLRSSAHLPAAKASRTLSRRPAARCPTCRGVFRTRRSQPGLHGI